MKVDCQSTLDMIGSSLGGGSAYSAKFHSMLEDSIKLNFPGNALINCMCHSTNDLYRCALFNLHLGPGFTYALCCNLGTAVQHAGRCQAVRGWSDIVLRHVVSWACKMLQLRAWVSWLWQMQ